MQVNLYYLLLILTVILSSFLILLVLIQKGRGGGLASAFGGVGGNTAFGAKTGDVLTWATSIIFGVLMLMTITLVMLGNSIHDANVRKQEELLHQDTAVEHSASANVDKSTAATVLPTVDAIPTTVPSTQPTTNP